MTFGTALASSLSLGADPAEVAFNAGVHWVPPAVLGFACLAMAAVLLNMITGRAKKTEDKAENTSLALVALTSTVDRLKTDCAQLAERLKALELAQEKLRDDLRNVSQMFGDFVKVDALQRTTSGLWKDVNEIRTDVAVLKHEANIK